MVTSAPERLWPADIPLATKFHSVGRSGGLGAVTVTGLDDTDRLACAAVPVEDPLDVHGVAVVALDGEHRVGDRRDLLLVEDARRGAGRQTSIL